MKVDYKNELFDQMSQLLEDLGKDDEKYDGFQKAADVLDVLESLLAYAIYSVSISSETVRDACEESYVNIKKRALRMMEQELAEKKAPA